MAMKYESAFVNGMIEDFATVICFLIDIFFFGVSFTIWSFIGCVLVFFVIITISFGKTQ